MLRLRRQFSLGQAFQTGFDSEGNPTYDYPAEPLTFTPADVPYEPNISYGERGHTAQPASDSSSSVAPYLLPAALLLTAANRPPQQQFQQQKKQAVPTWIWFAVGGVALLGVVMASRK